MNTKTQNQVLLKELKKRKLTVRQIANQLGIGSPTRRICDLKKKHDIESVKTKVTSRWGKSVIATYVLK